MALFTILTGVPLLVDNLTTASPARAPEPADDRDPAPLTDQSAGTGPAGTGVVLACGGAGSAALEVGATAVDSPRETLRSRCPSTMEVLAAVAHRDREPG